MEKLNVSLTETILIKIDPDGILAASAWPSTIQFLIMVRIHVCMCDLYHAWLSTESERSTVARRTGVHYIGRY